VDALLLPLGYLTTTGLNLPRKTNDVLFLVAQFSLRTITSVLLAALGGLKSWIPEASMIMMSSPCFAGMITHVMVRGFLAGQLL